MCSRSLPEQLNLVSLIVIGVEHGVLDLEEVASSRVRSRSRRKCRLLKEWRIPEGWRNGGYLREREVLHLVQTVCQSCVTITMTFNLTLMRSNLNSIMKSEEEMEEA